MVSGLPEQTGATKSAPRVLLIALLAATAGALVLASLPLVSRWLALQGLPREGEERLLVDDAPAAHDTPSPEGLSDDLWGFPFPSELTEEALYQDLERLAARIVADFPARPEALAVAAMERMFRGKCAEAAEFWKRAAALDSKYPEAYFGLAQIVRQRGDFEEAARLARQAWTLDPAHDEAARFLADTLLNLGEADEAIQILKTNLKVNPRSAVSFYLLGQSYVQHQAFREARDAFEKAVTLSPRYTHAYYGLATACERLGDREGARLHREKFNALKEQEQSTERQDVRNPKDLPLLRRGAAAIYATAGNVYHRHGRPNAAEAIWKRGLRCDPKGVRCREALARFYERSFRPAEALALYQELRAIAPDNPEYELGVAQQQMRLDQTTEAENGLLALCRRLPQWSRPAAALAQLYLHTGRGREETLRWALKAVELEPVAAHYFLLGLAYDQGGSREQALAALRRAVELEPDNQPCREAYESLTNRP